MSANYAILIFGSMDNVRELLVKELQIKRESIALSPDELEEILIPMELGDDWPGISEIEENPQLLTFAYIQRVGWFLETHPKLFDRAVCITGVEIAERINEYLEHHREVIPIAIQEFTRTTSWKKLPTRSYSHDTDFLDEKVEDEDPTWDMSPQSIAEMHIFFEVMEQLDLQYEHLVFSNRQR